MIKVIEKICMGYTGMGYQYGENISSKKEKNARQYFNIPNEERIIALIDGTLMGSCKNGLAICDNGLYWSNPWMTKTNITRMMWDEYVFCNGIKLKSSDIYLTDGAVIATIGYFDEKDMLKLLKELQVGIKSFHSQQQILSQQNNQCNTKTPPPFPPVFSK